MIYVVRRGTKGWGSVVLKWSKEGELGKTDGLVFDLNGGTWRWNLGLGEVDGVVGGVVLPTIVGIFLDGRTVDLDGNGLGVSLTAEEVLCAITEGDGTNLTECGGPVLLTN